MHSLLNVLRFCQLGALSWAAACQPRQLLVFGGSDQCARSAPTAAAAAPAAGVPPRPASCHAMLTPPAPTCAGSEGEPPLLGEDGQRVLHGCMELDYMTHIVLRMFENTT